MCPCTGCCPPRPFRRACVPPRAARRRSPARQVSPPRARRCAPGAPKGGGAPSAPKEKSLQTARAAPRVASAEGRRTFADMAAALASIPVANGCDLVKLLASTGSSCLLLRVWRDGQPYFCRSQVVNTLTRTTDKRLRVAVAKAQAEEEEVSS